MFGCKSNQYGYQANNLNISPKDSILSSEKIIIKNNIIVFYPEDKYFINILKKDTIYKIYYRGITVGDFFKDLGITLMNIEPFSSNLGEVSNVVWYNKAYEVIFYVKSPTFNMFMDNYNKESLMELKIDSILSSKNRTRLNLNITTVEL